MLKSLFHIENEYLEIAQQLIDGEATQELQDALAINEKELQVKSINYSFIIKQMDAECDIIDGEIERLNKLKKARVNSVTRLKESIKNAMELYQIAEIKAPIIKINFSKSKSVEVENIELLDEKYIKITTTESINKTLIKEDIEKGEIVTGAILKENKHLQIK